MSRMRMAQAISLAIAAEMSADERVVLIGEDVGAAGGVFKTSAGLIEQFGPDRVRDTPIAEMGFLGAAVGAAMRGIRPIVEIMFVEFLGVALDQLVTEAAKLRYLSAGGFTVPLVVRASTGAGLGFGAQHSQTLESWFTSTPGLKVVCPSDAGTAYGLVRAAVRDDDPVLILEPRVLYGERGEVDSEAPPPVIGKARLLQRGSAATLVSLGQSVATCREAAANGLDVDVIDLLSIAPWDVAAVTESVRRTGRLITVEASGYSGGWGGMIISEIAATSFAALTAPPLRITAPDTPVPYAADLEQRYLPTADYVTDQVNALIATNQRPAPWWQEASHV
jgi:pyruvate/2-oxoglutarate/acetoin dehydrogenase E1 component